MVDDTKENLFAKAFNIPFLNKDSHRNRIPINEETREWSPELDTSLPIDGAEIPRFKEWVNWNGFQLDRQTARGHDGFDFAAYLTTDGRIVLGLPEDTKIRAIADGNVRQVLDTPEAVGGGYGVMINVEHGSYDSGMYSQYIHVKPKVQAGEAVKKGDVIAELYKDEGNDTGRLVHLHLSLFSGWGTRGTSIAGGGSVIRADDPRIIDSSIYRYSSEPQGNSTFILPDFPHAKIEIANFDKVRVND